LDEFWQILDAVIGKVDKARLPGAVAQELVREGDSARAGQPGNPDLLLHPRSAASTRQASASIVDV